MFDQQVEDIFPCAEYSILKKKEKIRLQGLLGSHGWSFKNTLGQIGLLFIPC